MLIPVILSGGAGTRIWPVSRESHPKPFIKMADGESLLLKTLQRALATGASEVLTVTNRDYYFITRDEYSALQPPAKVELRYLLEPAGRNTAPAIAAAAFAVKEQAGAEFQPCNRAHPDQPVHEAPLGQGASPGCAMRATASHISSRVPDFWMISPTPAAGARARTSSFM